MCSAPAAAGADPDAGADAEGPTPVFEPAATMPDAAALSGVAAALAAGALDKCEAASAVSALFELGNAVNADGTIELRYMHAVGFGT
jgi:hypothetical protein